MVQIWHPTSDETHMWGKRPAAMLAIYTGKCFALEVNLREHIETQRRRHKKSKIGVSVAPKDGNVSNNYRGEMWKFNQV